MTKKSSPALTAIDQDVLYFDAADERANIATHTLGFLLSLLAAAFFWQTSLTADLGLRISCLVFCVTMAVVYFFSTLSHMAQQPRVRNRLRAWDQGTIYFLIVGTYSPFIWQATDGTWRIVLMSAVWIAALAGFYSKVFATHRVNSVATLTYLALGWLPAIPLIYNTPLICFIWMLLGGVAYSVGVVFLKKSLQVRYAHAVWHVMVILGSSCHCYAVYKLLELSN